MSIGEILRIGAIDTALGMGTVFAILIFISICIWALGMAFKPKAKAAPAPAAAPEPQSTADPNVIDPEIIAVITAAIHQHIKDEHGDDATDTDQYIVRKVRRATWKHTS